MKSIRALSFSSWFSVPDQGMKDFEILCRASAFLLPVKSKVNVYITTHFYSSQFIYCTKMWKSSTKYHVLTAAHAAAPWKFPKLYPNDWLRFVNQDHTIFTVETRHKDGSMQSQIDLLPEVFYHPTRDLAVLHFENELEALEVLRFVNVEYKLELTDEDLVDNSFTDELTFTGYDVEDVPFNQDYKLDRKRILRNVVGKPILRTKHQIFCPTKPILTDGMCGGPVLRGNPPVDGSHKIVCGLLEGIVPSSFAKESIRGAAVFVETGEIRQFLADIEENKIQPLISGSVQNIVGADQDLDKMNLQKLLDGE